MFDVLSDFVFLWRIIWWADSTDEIIYDDASRHSLANLAEHSYDSHCLWAYKWYSAMPTVLLLCECDAHRSYTSLQGTTNSENCLTAYKQWLVARVQRGFCVHSTHCHHMMRQKKKTVSQSRILILIQILSGVCVAGGHRILLA